MKSSSRRFRARARWISAVYTPTWDAQGVPDGWVAVVLDIEERKQAEEVLRPLPDARAPREERTTEVAGQ